MGKAERWNFSTSLQLDISQVSAVVCQVEAYQIVGQQKKWTTASCGGRGGGGCERTFTLRSSFHELEVNATYPPGDEASCRII